MPQLRTNLCYSNYYMKTLVLMMVWLAVGCSGAPDVFKADGWTAEQLAALDRAGRAWCEATKGQCCPTLGDGSSELHGVDGTWTGAPGVHMHRSDGSEIWIDRRYDVETVQYIALHEFGHHCGFNPAITDAHEWFCASGSISPADLKAAGY